MVLVSTLESIFGPLEKYRKKKGALIQLNEGKETLSSIVCTRATRVLTSIAASLILIGVCLLYMITREKGVLASGLCFGLAFFILICTIAFLLEETKTARVSEINNV